MDSMELMVCCLRKTVKLNHSLTEWIWHKLAMAPFILTFYLLTWKPVHAPHISYTTGREYRREYNWYLTS